ncbi:AAA family ATPase [Pelagibius sp.]|uniref:AAA family ATPase n=1 Tax=Pelagibius sp. TaxID=1931238 RepID=UPI003BB1492D
MSPSKIVYLMRGLPSSGKSYTARRLVGVAGIVLETDSYFYSEVGENPTRYDYDAALLPEARDWNFARYLQALQEGHSPIVVDRGNGLSLISQAYARHAVEFGYRVVLREPESPWWAELRALLKHPESNGPTLELWARRLARLNRSTHGTSAGEIRYRMAHWRTGLRIEDILRYRSE